MYFSMNHGKLIFINSNLHTRAFSICIRKETVTNTLNFYNIFFYNQQIFC